MTVYFLCPKPSDPSGGVWWIHRLAEMAGGAVLQVPERFDVTWDAHPEKQARTVDMGDTLPWLKRQDVTWVIPEIMWADYSKSVMGRKVLFVQSQTWLDKRFDLTGVEAWTCSRYLCNYLKRVHGIPSKKITPFVDDDVWQGVKKKPGRVLVMARRNTYYEDMLDRLAQANWDVVAVYKAVTQRELAGYLAECDYYLHLTHPEGFPELCLEAMRSKTVVVGTTGGGGNEFCFNGQTMWVVQDPQNGHYNDGSEFVDRVMAGLNYLDGDPVTKEKIREKAFQWSLRYTEEQTKKELLEALG